MKHILALALLAVLSSLLSAEDRPTPKKYNRDVSTWMVVRAPDPKDYNAYEGFFLRANHSQVEWNLFLDHGKVMAYLWGDEDDPTADARPVFSMARVISHEEPSEPAYVQQTEDGWLAGYNRGEFGSALWWFDKEGKSSYEISHHQVNQFFKYEGRYFAVEGLAHLGFSEGSVIEITLKNRKWIAETFVELPESGEAAAILPDGRVCIATTRMLLALSMSKTMEILVPRARWYYPHVIQVDAKAGHVYVGMRQFVARYDLGANSRRIELLIPGLEFLNKKY